MNNITLQYEDPIINQEYLKAKAKQVKLVFKIS